MDKEFKTVFTVWGTKKKDNVTYVYAIGFDSGTWYLDAEPIVHNSSTKFLGTILEELGIDLANVVVEEGEEFEYTKLGREVMK